MGLSPRLATAFALVLLLPAFAGCNFQDWYNQQGTIKVFMSPQGPSNTSLSDFRTLKLAVYGVAIKQQLVVDAQNFAFTQQPLIVDMVQSGVKGEKVLLATARESIRPVEAITLTVDVAEAVDAQGKVVPVCREGQTAPTTFPCIFLGANGAIRFQDRFVPIPRGGTVDFGFPVAVKLITTQPARPEYILLTDQSIATIENH